MKIKKLILPVLIVVFGLAVFVSALDFETNVVIKGTLDIQGISGAVGVVNIIADAGEDNTDRWKIEVADGGSLTIQDYGSGSWVTNWTMEADGDIVYAQDLYLDSANVINFHSGDITIAHSVNKLTVAGATTWDMGAVATLDFDGTVAITVATGDVDISAASIGVDATEKVLLDGISGHTYWAETSADEMSGFVGGVEAITVKEDTDIEVGINRTNPLVNIGSSYGDYGVGWSGLHIKGTYGIVIVEGDSSSRLHFSDTGAVTNQRNYVLDFNSGSLVFQSFNDGFGLVAIAMTIENDGDVVLGENLYLDSAAVINFHSGDVTVTHSVNLLAIAGGNTRVDRLEIDGASDYIDVSTDMDFVSAADMVLTPSGTEVHIVGGLSVGDETDVGDNNFKVVGTSLLEGTTTLTTAGVTLAGADGVLTITGIGDGNDENLTFDFDNATANEVNVASGTAVSAIEFGTIDLKTDYVWAQTFDTDVAAAAITLSDTTLAADGTQTNINLNLVPKGTGVIMVSGAQLDSDDLSDVASIGMLDEAESITGNWVNTTNPWADNEVAAFATGTKGDIHYSSATNTWTELGIGSDNQMLVVATDVPNWETASSDLLSDVASIFMLDEDETVTGRPTFSDLTTFSDSVIVTDDTKQYFGTGYDFSMEYDEDGDDHMIFAGTDINMSGKYLVNEQGKQDLSARGPTLYLITDDYVEVTHDADIDVGTADFSIQMVIRPNDISGTEYLINKEAGGVGYGLYMTDDDLYIRFDDNTADASAIIGTACFLAGVEYDVHVTFDRDGNATAYVNGVSVGTVAISGSALTLNNAGALRIGCTTAGASFFDGQITFVKIYDRLNSLAEVKALQFGSVPYKYIGANQTELVSGWTNHSTSPYETWSSVGTNIGSGGTPVINNVTEGYAYSELLTIVKGKQYRMSFTITDHSGGTVTAKVGTDGSGGNSINDIAITADGNYSEEFTASAGGSYRAVFRVNDGVTAAFAMNSFSFHTIGCVANYSPSSINIAEAKWYDQSGNGLHGAISGAVINNPIPQLYIELEEPVADDRLLSVNKNVSASRTEVFWIDEDGDMDALGDVSGTTIGGITEANLLDKTATETVSGSWTFSAKGAGIAALTVNDSVYIDTLVSAIVTAEHLKSTDDIEVADDILMSDGGVIGITGNEIITFNAAGTIVFSGAEAHFTNNAAAATFGLVTTDADVVLAFDAVTYQGSITYMEDEDRFDFDNDVDVIGDLTAATMVSDGIITGADTRMPTSAPGSPVNGSFYLGTADTLWVYSGAAWKYEVLSTP